MEHLGRLVFSLSAKQINTIPLVRLSPTHHTATNHAKNYFFCIFFFSVHLPKTVLNKDTVEQVLVGQSRWEDSVVGRVCATQCVDRQHQKQQTQSLIRGIVKARSRRAKGPVDIQ